MQIIEKPLFLQIEGEDPLGGPARLTVVKTNRGEPYRDVIDIDLYFSEYDRVSGITLDLTEARALHGVLGRVLEAK